jgi:TetR/AcrR family transcriptional regulator, fatty acid metabolism regulator protein
VPTLPEEPARPAAEAQGGRAGSILRAALAVMAERGYAAATVRDITERAGVAAGTFYLYFPAKEAAGLALIEALYAEAVAAAAARRHDTTDPAGKLLASMDGVLSTFSADPLLARFVLVLAPGAHPAFDRRLFEVHEALCALVRADLEAILASPTGADARRADLASQAVVGAVAEMVTAWVRQGAPTGGLDDAAAVLQALFAHGLGGLRP